MILYEEVDFKPKDLETLLTDPKEEGDFIMVALVDLLWLALWSMQRGEIFIVDMVANAMINLKINQYNNINILQNEVVVYSKAQELNNLYTNEYN